jgi:glycosyltransferase involved in cell wall biosynthesis
MRIAIVTDAWLPQTNGVVTTLQNTVSNLRKFGHEVEVITPEGLTTVPCPTYPEIRLALFPRSTVNRRIDQFNPDALHIATEGPLGSAARAYAISRGRSFTSSYHTQFPEYISARFPIPAGVVYAYLRCFHSRATRVLVGTEEMRRDLRQSGFRRVVPWTRGVDTERFVPPALPVTRDRPTLLYVGRVAIEKGVEDFCRVDVDARKVIVGDGPQLATLRARYPNVEFMGFRYGDELVAAYQSADCFVFPSRTDTFGLVMLEAMACGLPVAAYPVTGPIDVVRHGSTGWLSEDLRESIIGALTLDRAHCRAQALEFSWEASARQFESHLVPFGTLTARRAAKRGSAHRRAPATSQVRSRNL